jgi:cell division inhibitor SepF
MAGAMRKMAVYLGLVEDDDRYEDYDDYDQYDERDGRRDQRDERPHAASADERGERTDRTERHSRDDRTRTLAPIRDDARSSVATMPTRRPAPTPAPAAAPSGLDRITTIHPRTYNEAKTIGEAFRGGTPVIMNLTDMDDADAKRLVDFAAGLVFGLHGTIERVTNKVFLLSPANVSVTAEDKARMAEGSFFNQS